jgi:ATP-dependent RNA helicase DDX31/DBP7
LPIINRLIIAQSESTVSPTPFDRTLGTVAIVLAPTRELAKQIYNVLERLLKYGLASSKKSEDQDSTKVSNHSNAFRHWIVPGIVIGGDKKKSEKSRLRKGSTVLISTPGNLPCFILKNELVFLNYS